MTIARISSDHNHVKHAAIRTRRILTALDILGGLAISPPTIRELRYWFPSDHPPEHTSERLSPKTDMRTDVQSEASTIVGDQSHGHLNLPALLPPLLQMRIPVVSRARP